MLLPWFQVMDWWTNKEHQYTKINKTNLWNKERQALWLRRALAEPPSGSLDHIKFQCAKNQVCDKKREVDKSGSRSTKYRQICYKTWGW